MRNERVRIRKCTSFESAGPRADAAELKADGSFELIASGGAVAPGPYLVSLEVNGQKSKTGIGKFKGEFVNVKQELKPGANDLTLDLAKPNG